MTTRARASINEAVYREYIEHLLRGDLPRCRLLVQRLLEGGVPVETLYLHLLQRTLYEVGDLWAGGRVSVAAEHMASAATEDLMRMVHPLVMGTPKTGRRAIISCTPDEYHQIGARMVADLMELAGWQVVPLGANTPVNSLVLLTEQTKPDLLGLSTTLPANVDMLMHTVAVVRDRFPGLPVIVGGQALHAMAGCSMPANVRCIDSVDQIHSL